MNQLLRLTVRPTAVFCYNDMIALGALKAIRRAKLSVPADISVADFDDIFVASYTDPPLTTVRQPTTAMGRRAMDTFEPAESDTRNQMEPGAVRKKS